MKNKNDIQRLVFIIFGIVSILVVFTTLSILGFIILRGVGKLNWDFISKYPESGMMEGGIFPAIVGTFQLIIGSCLIAFPIGILSGIYMNEYAPRNIFKKFIGMMTNNLAGIPSIVFGLFGLAVFVNYCNLGVSLLSGCLTMAILILPVIIRTTEESLKMVEESNKTSSYALGASKFQTIYGVVLPMALPNIMTGLVLSIGRVAGETAPIIFTAAAYYLPEIILSWKAPVMALPYHLYVMSTSGINLNKSRDIAFGTALVLLLLVLAINFLAGWIKKSLTKTNR